MRIDSTGNLFLLVQTDTINRNLQTKQWNSPKLISSISPPLHKPHVKAKLRYCLQFGLKHLETSRRFHSKLAFSESTSVGSLLCHRDGIKRINIINIIINIIFLGDLKWIRVLQIYFFLQISGSVSATKLGRIQCAGPEEPGTQHLVCNFSFPASCPTQLLALLNQLCESCPFSQALWASAAS